MNFNIFIDDMLNKLNDRILTQKEILDYILFIADEFEYGEYLNGVYNDSIKDSTTLATYNFEKRIITIDYDHGINVAKGNVKNIPEIKKDDYILYINTLLLLNIYHELNHGYQAYLMCETEFFIAKEFYKELTYIDKNPTDYLKYYYLLSYERDAIVTSIENILRMLINNFKDKNSLIDFYYSYLDYQLRLGYTLVDGKLSSPIDTLYSELFKEDTIHLHDSDTYFKMKLGYPIDICEYNAFYNSNFKSLINKKL